MLSPRYKLSPSPNETPSAVTVPVTLTPVADVANFSALSWYKLTAPSARNWATVSPVYFWSSVWFERIYKTPVPASSM